MLGNGDNMEFFLTVIGVIIALLVLNFFRVMIFNPGQYLISGWDKYFSLIILCHIYNIMKEEVKILETDAFNKIINTDSKKKLKTLMCGLGYELGRYLGSISVNKKDIKYAAYVCSQIIGFSNKSALSQLINNASSVEKTLPIEKVFWSKNDPLAITAISFIGKDYNYIHNEFFSLWKKAQTISMMKKENIKKVA